MVCCVTSDTRTRRSVAWAIAAIAGCALLLYGLYVGWLSIMATEGDVPSASSIPLPAGAEILSEDKSCGSGGCTLVLVVAPPDGQSPADLAIELGVTPQLRLPGNLLDPRTVNVSGSAGDQTLQLWADFFSTEYVP